MIFKKTIGDYIIEKLKDNLKSANFKAYYYGDPFLIPQSLMPCIIVENEKSSFTVGTTAQDDNFQTIVVKIVFNKKADFGKKPTEVAGHRRLKELAEGVDDSTGQVSQSSVVGILRKNFTLGSEVVNQTIDVQYGVMPRPEGSITEEAHIRGVYRRLTTVSDRA